MSETIKGYTPILKLDFLKIEFQRKTWFLENQVIAELNLKKKIINKLWNLSSMNSSSIQGTQVSIEELEFLENIQVELEFPIFYFSFF